MINNQFGKTESILHFAIHSNSVGNKTDYEEDVRKYAEGLEQTKIISVYRSIPAQLAKENKKFQFSKINKNARSREYTGCIEWLIDAGVITECNCLFFPELFIAEAFTKLVVEGIQ